MRAPFAVLGCSGVFLKESGVPADPVGYSVLSECSYSSAFGTSYLSALPAGGAEQRNRALLQGQVEHRAGGHDLRGIAERGARAIRRNRIPIMPGSEGYAKKIADERMAGFDGAVSKFQGSRKHFHAARRFQNQLPETKPAAERSAAGLFSKSVRRQLPPGRREFRQPPCCPGCRHRNRW
jgi:hypothetical protein